MIFGTDQPANITWSTSGSAGGSAILSPVSAFIDGRPDTLVRLQWISVATLNGTMSLQADWPVVQGVRVIAISNISLPAGIVASVAFRRSTDGAGTYPYTAIGSDTNAPQKIVQLERGEQTMVIVLPAAMTAVQGVKITFTNNVGGSAPITASQQFTIGEVMIRSGLEFDAKPGWSIKRTDPTTRNFSNQTPYTNPGSPFRTMQFEFPLDIQTAYFGDLAAPTLIDYEQIVAKLDRGKTVFYIPRYRNAAGVIDPQILHRSSFIGTLTGTNQITQKSGIYFDSDRFTVLESPIPT